MSVLETIEKPETVLIAVCVLVLTVSTPHIALTVADLVSFEEVLKSTVWDFRVSIALGVFFAVFLEISMMYFAMKNKTWISVLFGSVSFVLSLYNYKLSLVEWSWKTLPSICICVTVPALIIIVSHHVVVQGTGTEKSTVQVGTQKTSVPRMTKEEKERKYREICDLINQGLTHGQILDFRGGGSKSTISEAKKWGIQNGLIKPEKSS